MTFRHFRIFDEVYRRGSFTAAAEELNMAQPAVSLAIKELETFYGVKLFERMNRTIYITEDGKKLHAYVSNILQQYQQSVRDLRHEDSGRILRIGANVTLGENLLPEMTALFRKRYPDTQFHISVENTSSIEEKLSRNELDLALVDNLSGSGNVVVQKIGTEKMAVVCSEKYRKFQDRRVSVFDLAEEALLLREKGSGTRLTVENMFSRYNLFPKPVMESISVTALIRAAAQGSGITFLSYEAVGTFLKSGDLIELEVPNVEFIRSYYLIYHKGKYLTQVMKDFINFNHEFT